MSRKVVVAGTLLAALLLFAQPHALFAWGPGTHVFLGLEVLRSLELLPASLAGLLSEHALEFLYGNLAADISMAKRYAPMDRHPHAWHIGEEMLEAAEDDAALQAGALGYLCHLAADVVAHESFVPRMLLLTSSTRALGHSYWEHRMDAAVGSDYTRLARSLVMEFDHSRVDELLNSVLASTLFSFRTNRRIFRGMIRLADYQPWQNLFDTVIDNSEMGPGGGRDGVLLPSRLRAHGRLPDLGIGIACGLQGPHRRAGPPACQAGAAPGAPGRLRARSRHGPAGRRQPALPARRPRAGVVGGAGNDARDRRAHHGSAASPGRAPHHGLTPAPAPSRRGAIPRGRGFPVSRPRASPAAAPASARGRRPRRPAASPLP